MLFTRNSIALREWTRLAILSRLNFVYQLPLLGVWGLLFQSLLFRFIKLFWSSYKCYIEYVALFCVQKTSNQMIKIFWLKWYCKLSITKHVEGGYWFEKIVDMIVVFDNAGWLHENANPRQHIWCSVCDWSHLPCTRCCMWQYLVLSNGFHTLISPHPYYNFLSPPFTYKLWSTMKQLDLHDSMECMC